MRRMLAIAIALLLGFTMAAPLVAVDAAGNLPSCCRRNGSHHCAGGMSDGAGKSATTASPKCPNFPKAIVAPLPFGISPPIARDPATPLFVHPAAAPQTEARYRASYARSRQKRGPPVDLL